MFKKKILIANKTAIIFENIISLCVRRFICPLTAFQHIMAYVT